MFTHLFDHGCCFFEGLHIAGLNALFHFKIESSGDAADFLKALLGGTGALKHLLSGVVALGRYNRTVEGATVFEIIRIWSLTASNDWLAISSAMAVDWLCLASLSSVCSLLSDVLLLVGRFAGLKVGARLRALQQSLVSIGRGISSLNMTMSWFARSEHLAAAGVTS